MKLEGDGKSEQIKTTGAQLFDAGRLETISGDGITVTILEDGAISLIGTATKDKFINFSLPEIIEAGTQITFSLNNTVINTTVGIRLAPEGQQSDMGTWFTITTVNAMYTAITTMAENRLIVRVANGSILNTKFNIMLTAGTVAKPWEPYSGAAPSPSPDYPQEIKSIGDSGKLDLHVVNGNLLDQETVLPAIGFVKQGDGCFYVAANNTVYNKHIWDNTMEYHGQLTLIYDYKFLSAEIVENGLSLGFQYSDGTRETPSLPRNTNWTTVKIVSNRNKIVESVSCSYGTNNNSTWIRNVAIYFGAIDNPVYTPHKGHQISISLSEPLRSAGDVHDRICRKNGEWGIERLIGTSVFDGTNAVWKRYLNSIYKGFSAPCPAMMIQLRGDGFCSHLPVLTSSNEYGVWLGVLGNTVFAVGLNDIATTVDEWNTWLSNNHMTIQYQLAIPTFEPLDEITQLKLDSIHTYSPITNIYTLDPLNPDLMGLTCRYW